jgi:hypothetical protein
MNEKYPDTVTPIKTDDQTDLFEIISFFWKGKYFVFGSSLIGIIAALFFYNSNPQRDAATYVVPINIQASILENGQEAVQRFNENINKYDFNSIVMDSKEFQDFSKHVFNLKIAVESGSAELQFSNILIDKSGESQIQFSKALAMKISKENLEKESQLTSKNSSPELGLLTEESLLKLKDAEKNYLLFSNQRGHELAALRIQVHEFVARNFSREVPDCSGCDIETFLNKALVANHYKNDSPEIKKKLNDAIINYFSMNGVIGAKYQTLIQDATDTIRQMMLNKFVTVDVRKGLSLSPTYSINFTAFSKLTSTSQHIRHRTTRILFLGVGCILGFVFGTLAFAGKEFVRVNKSKLLASLKN